MYMIILIVMTSELTYCSFADPGLLLEEEIVVLLSTDDEEEEVLEASSLR